MNDDRITIPARLGKEAQLGHNDTWPGDLVSVSLGALASEAARNALAGLNTDLSRAMLDAFRAGMDFLVGPVDWTEPSLADAFAPRSIFEPIRTSVQVKAGPVEPGAYDEGLPVGWTLYRLADWNPQ